MDVHLIFMLKDKSWPLSMDELPNAVYQAPPFAFPSVHMTRSRIPMKHVVPVRILVPKIIKWFLESFEHGIFFK